MLTPPQYQKAEVSDCPRHSKAVMAWLESDLPGLITFTGPAGTGKTHMLYAIAKLCKQPRLWDIPTLCVAIQRAAVMSPDAYNWTERHQLDVLIKHTSQVLLDDLGAEKTTPFVLQELYRLISQRELWARPTLITTNLSLDQLAQKLDDRIASRLAGGRVLLFKGEDWRAKRSQL